MKKIFSNFIVRMNKTVFVFATAAVCALGTVSCGGDDDGDEAGGGGSSAGNTESGVIQTPTGGKVRVAKAGGYTFSYNSDGSLASFFDRAATFENDTCKMTTSIIAERAISFTNLLLISTGICS